MSSKKNNINTKNKYFMNLALKQAARSLGNTGTNPPVGSVITDKKGNLISFGRTGSKGKPHAEFNAIKNSQKKLTNSNMFVTLEPCTHYAQTPPCTNLIIKNKIKKVYYSIDDVDIRTAKKGKKTLANARVIIFIIKTKLQKCHLLHVNWPYLKMVLLRILKIRIFQMNLQEKYLIFWDRKITLS